MHFPKWLGLGLLSALGAVIGAVAVVGVQAASREGEHKAPSRAAEPARRADRSDYKLSARLARLEGRVSALGTDAPPPSGAEAAAADSARAGGDAEQRLTEPPVASPAVREEFWAAQRATWAAHDAEVADPEWAPRTSSAVSDDLAELAHEVSFAFSSVDCRTTTCLTKITWSSTDAATAQYTRLLHHPYRANCQRSFVLDEDEAGAPQASGTLFFDCETWRAEGQAEL